MNQYFIVVLAVVCSQSIMASDVVKVENKPLSRKTHELFNTIWQEKSSVDVGEVEQLLADGADPKATRFEYGADWDSLSAAIFEGRFDLVTPLVKGGAQPNKALYPPIGFMAALYYGYAGCCSSAGKVQGHHEYCFPIRAAANNTHTHGDSQQAFENALACLIKAKADVDSRMDDLPTAAIMALCKGDNKVGSMLIEEGADVDFVLTKVVTANDVRAMLKKRSSSLKKKQLKSGSTPLTNEL